MLTLGFVQSEIVTSETTGEDETSVSRHLKAMQEEMKQTVKNDAILDDRMAGTMSARRADVATKPLRDILAAYPALQLDSQAGCFFGIITLYSIILEMFNGFHFAPSR